MLVEKRDGRVVPFDKEKIVTAIEGAFIDLDKASEYSHTKAREIANFISNTDREYISVEEIQDIIEQKLMASQAKDVAKQFIIYRNEREKIRLNNSKLIRLVGEKLRAENVMNQNANVDERSFGGRIGEASRAVTKQYALDNLMSTMSKENHINNMIYIHDLDSYAVGMHNCLSIPFDDLLANGFTTRQCDIRPANSINTAFQLIAVISQIQSLQQFGGVSATHLDWTMVPYVRKSFYKHYMDGMHYIEGLNDTYVESNKWIEYRLSEGIDAECYKSHSRVYQYAMDMTEKELTQAVEGMFHNLNSLQSRSGNQLPFSSINYGSCTLPEGRMVTKALLKGSIKGVGKHHRTSIFPCCIFKCKKGINLEEGDPNYDLFKLALESTAKRLYPNYANVDWSGNAGYDPNDPRTEFSTINNTVA